MYNDLAKLSRGHLDIGQLRLLTIRAAYNLMYSGGMRADPSAAHRFYDDIVAGVGADLDQPEFRSVLSNATGVMILIYLQARDKDAFERMVRELEHAPYRDEVRTFVDEQLKPMGLQLHL
jgi:hypothetical protein